MEEDRHCGVIQVKLAQVLNYMQYNYASKLYSLVALYNSILIILFCLTNPPIRVTLNESNFEAIETVQHQSSFFFFL